MVDKMNEEKDIAVQITGLKKRYRLGVIGGGTLRGDLQSWWARVRHKEDPNSKIGAKIYGKNETFMALDGIDLTIYKGERIGIIGHNGAGKSTLLKLLSRVTGPTEGEIKIDGRISSMLEVGTGFNAELTGRENVYINGAILGMTKKEVDSKIEDIIEFSEVRQFIDTPVKRYSSGMYVKLAFSVAAHLDSEILIMDEVLAVGDMAFQRKCLDKMNQVSQDEGRTILYVSHNMNTIRQLCNRVVVLDHGKVVYDGDVEEGIGVYLGGSKNSCEKRIAFNKEDNLSANKDNKELFINAFEVLDDYNYIYNLRSHFAFCLEWYSVKEFKNVSLRVQLIGQSGLPVINYVLESSIDIKQGDDKKEFDIDLAELMYGKYKLSFAFSYTLIDGKNETLAVVLDAVSIEIRKREKDVFWVSKYWGCIKSNRITMK